MRHEKKIIKHNTITAQSLDKLMIYTKNSNRYLVKMYIEYIYTY